MAKEKNKKTYGELGHVKLTDEELKKLQARFPDLVDKYIEKLDLYIEQQGRDKYSSHYATIIIWVKEDLEKKSNRKNSISRPATYDLKQIEKDALNNTTIKY